MRLARSARRRALLAAVLCTLAAAPAARAGQIVWSAQNAIWAANDDGSMPRRLIAGSDPRLAGILPQGSVAAPDAFQGGGTAVLFLGSTSAFAPIGTPAACGQGCTDSFALRSGGLVDLGPAPGPLPDGAYYESQPRLTADGQELFSWALWSGVGAAAAGSARTELAQRPIPNPQDLGIAWSDTASASAPPSGFDGAPDPANPLEAAWVEAQGCVNYTLNGEPACEFAVHFGTRSAANAPVSIYDKEYQGAAGGATAGPTSLDWSADGSSLLMVDPFAPNDGIYEFAAMTVATPDKPVTEVLAQPPGWTFNQVRFAGSMIVFDAHQGTGATQTGDIFTIPASCTAATCTFPASATNLTNNPTADASDPAWTSATTSLVPFDGTVTASTPGAARATAATLQSAPIHAGRPFEIRVTLNAAATIVVTITPRHPGQRTRPVGSTSFHGAAGVNRLRIGRIAGSRLAAGTYQATIRAQGSVAKPISLRFTVVAP